MSRWEPDARGRLEQAALDLYRERGYDNTAVAEIAARAGLTERTFYRHYADKREVLFGRAEWLQAFLMKQVADAPPSFGPLAAVTGALEAAGAAMFGQRRDHAPRWAVINANRELQERELVKLASLSAALTDALRGRGVDSGAATLAAETGIAIFKVAFIRWVTDTSGTFADAVTDCADELATVVIAGRQPTDRAKSTLGDQL